MQIYLRKNRWLLTVALLQMLLFTACKVMLIGAYDQVTDMGIQKVQTEVSTIIIKMETNIDNSQPAENDYAKFVKSYDEVKGELESLRIRTGALPKYSLVMNQVVLMNDNVILLEKIHRLGITRKEDIAVPKKTLEIAFQTMITLQNGLKREKTK